MTNIEIEKLLDVLSDLCCESLAGDGRSLAERKTPLLKDLLECGFARSYVRPLQVELEERVRTKWSERILVHRKELESLTAKLQHQFNDLKRLQVKQPQETNPPDAANLNTAGHATKRRDLR